MDGKGEALGQERLQHAERLCGQTRWPPRWQAVIGLGDYVEAFRSDPILTALQTRVLHVVSEANELSQWDVGGGESIGRRHIDPDGKIAGSIRLHRRDFESR